MFTALLACAGIIRPGASMGQLERVLLAAAMTLSSSAVVADFLRRAGIAPTSPFAAVLVDL
jgi:hypothetical protein